uniref:AB hydrolase-1 domain-containing protein n=1 Tax=Bionectria ochroleuca TaxID=29856 RepID=A0A0B7KIY7_BIOOC
MKLTALRSTITAVCLTIGTPVLLYFGILGALTARPSFQAHAIYLHKVTLTWFKDLNVPEQFGFAYNQVKPFYVPTPDGERLHSWHILPLRAYIDNQPELLAQGSGLVDSFEETLNFKLLKNNPNARLVLYFHGTSGTIASGWRPDSYRSIYAADPINTHILAFDYRGYGKSSGEPSEGGIIQDALTIAAWAMEVAGIPPERIVIYGQSLGSAVSIALVNELVKREQKTHFAGLVVTATFSDVAQLAATYRIGGVIPVLSPVAKVGPLFKYFTSRLTSTWDNQKRLGEIIELAEQFDITLLHAEDDPIIPIGHSHRLFRHLINIAEEAEIYSDVDANESLAERLKTRQDSWGKGGSVLEWPTSKGTMRFVTLKYGAHDEIMSYTATSIAISKAFGSASYF